MSSSLSIIKTGEDFEDYVIEILHSAGTEATATPKSHDYGADIIAEREGHRYAIQCKYYKGAVGIAAVQEVISALKFYNAEYGAVVTNSTYTQEARTLAAVNNICLIDGDMLFSQSFDQNNILFESRNGNVIESDWNVTDLTIRYGVKPCIVHQYFMSKGMPYFKIGREYKFKPRKVKDWEIDTHEIRLPKGEVITLPEYERYKSEKEKLIREYEYHGEWKKARAVRKEMRSHGIEVEGNPMRVGLPVILLSGMMLALLDTLTR